MLEFILAGPVPSRKPPKPESPATPAPAGAQRTIKKTAQTTTTRETVITPAPAPAAAPGLTGPARAPRPRDGVPVLTLERFEQAMQVARLAADHGMHSLSARAVRESLKGGPPVVPMPVRTSRSGIIMSSSRGETAPDPVTPQVE